jgi:hypothetical protein
MNNIRQEGEICIIELCGNQRVIKGEAIIDAKDLPLVVSYHWTFYGGYAQCRKENLYLHHLILHGSTLLSGVECDHINNNKLDNRRCNLRYCNHAQNMMNRVLLEKKNKSGYRGVSWCPVKKKWRVVISYNRQYKHIGYYKNKEFAAKAYNEAAIQYFGKFAKFNEIKEGINE